MVKKLLTYGTPKRLFVSGSPKKLTAGEAECECCPEGEQCEFCNTGKTPQQLEMTVGGVANASCGNCGTYNGVFVLQQVSEAKPCLWCYTFTPDPCPSWALIHQVYLASGAVWARVCGFNVCGVFDPSQQARFRKYNPPADCTTWNFDMDQESSGSLICNGYGATCHIRSL